MNRPMTLQKHRKTYPNQDVIDQKPQTQKLKYIFLILNYKTSRVFTGFEQLSSSICCRVMVGQNLPWESKSYLLCIFSFLSEVKFLSHNFGPRCARKSLKGFKDAEFGQVSKKIWPKKLPVGWRPGQGKPGQKGENTPTCDVTHREPQTQNWKNFWKRS